MRYELYSPLPPDECVRRIERRLDRGEPRYRADRPLWGKIEAQTFSLRLAKGARNPLAPYFKGQWGAEQGGTRFSGECRITEGVKIGAVLWAILWIVAPLSLAVVAGGIWIGALLALGDTLRQLGEETYRALWSAPSALCWLPVASLLFGLGFPILFIGLRRGDCAKIVALLEELLEAEVSVLPEV